MFNKYHLVVGDTAKILEHTCIDHNDDPIDLTDCIVRIRFKISDGDWKVMLMVVYGDPTAGVARYQWAAGDIDESGTMKYQVEIENSSGEIARNDDWQYLEVRPAA